MIPIPLESLVAGERAQIVDVSGEAGLVARLAEVGIRSGVVIEMCQPGSPCILRIGSGRLSLRSDDRLHILVAPCPKHPAMQEEVA